jgi:hypothetical protein
MASGGGIFSFFVIELAISIIPGEYDSTRKVIKPAIAKKKLPKARKKPFNYITVKIAGKFA